MEIIVHWQGKPFSDTNLPITLTVEAASSTDILVKLYQMTPCHMAEDSDINL